jgi:hypothetical protein
LKVGGEDVGKVSARRMGMRFEYSGWYWYAVSDRLHVPLRNTAAEDTYYKDIEEAKRACKEYVTGCIAKKEKE